MRIPKLTTSGIKDRPKTIEVEEEGATGRVPAFDYTCSRVISNRRMIKTYQKCVEIS
jgi:hypothetical protein